MAFKSELEARVVQHQADSTLRLLHDAVKSDMTLEDLGQLIASMDPSDRGYTLESVLTGRMGNGAQPLFRIKPKRIIVSS